MHDAADFLEHIWRHGSDHYLNDGGDRYNINDSNVLDKRTIASDPVVYNSLQSQHIDTRGQSKRAEVTVGEAAGRLTALMAGAGRRISRRREGWLTDRRGRPYRPRSDLRAVGFRVLYQAREGCLWQTVVDAVGVPRVVDLQIGREELLAVVGAGCGSIQLVPVDAQGRQAGDPPEMIAIDGQHNAVASAARPAGGMAVELAPVRPRR